MATSDGSDYGAVVELSPLVRRVLARNPGPFTERGTATFIVGRGRVAVIDPGPDDPAHVEALLGALGGETVTHILVTHTHRDHSPATAALQAATGAPSHGFGPHGVAEDRSADTAFSPDHRLADGDVVAGPGWRLQALHTPGHASNHLCFALPEEATLFSGDHVMGWSTTVIAPPDGDMAVYRRSLERLLGRDDALYRPTHGRAIEAPQVHVRRLLDHRQRRVEAILARLAAGDRTVPELVAAIYQGLPAALLGAAGQSVLAQLIELVADGAVAAEGPLDKTGRFRPARRSRG
jgi:glyoxylase-like metal-dependent hydrolase (beta-lactamase superfamily II)